MKLPVGWIREWVNPRVDERELAARLTRAGLECEVEPASPLPDDVVVGAIRALKPHPQADRLRVCEVDAGAGRHLQIVCGAANAAAGMKAPVALVGAKLPDGTEIRKAALRGVDSAGMLCSAKELGLAEKSEGLFELDAAAVPGAPIARHLRLGDATLVLELTPNRGDCLGVAGLAREIGAVFGARVRPPAVKAPRVTGSRRLGIRIAGAKDCPRYAGRVIEGIDPRARTPDWMRERLRRAGVRAISPVVDVTNYVMLELGQPLHAFDCARLEGGIQVRRARAVETLELLNGQVAQLGPGDLVIADDARALALAGIMGGQHSGVGGATADIFLESACFAPALVAATGRRLRIASDALYRFERGVDPTLQRAALERASELIVAIAGGRAGPVVEAGARKPKAVKVRLRRARMDRLLGYVIPDAVVTRSLGALGVPVRRAGKGAWEAAIPGHRYDLRLEVDLIEEVARLYGYERIPARPYAAALAPTAVPETRPLDLARERLVARGYFEAINYAFVDAGLQQRLAPEAPALALDNPIADTLAVMRTTLWSGLLPAWRYNQQRQQKRVRLFETGVCFELQGSEVRETERLALVAAGGAAPEQWGIGAREVDFFDVKADVEALFGSRTLEFEAAAHPALHPGQSARIRVDGRPAGWLGRLNPALAAALDAPAAPILAEIDTSALAAAGVPRPAAYSEFPQSRRDLAVVLAEAVPAAALLQAARGAGGPALRSVGLFDLYRGAGLPNGFKSAALSLIFQDNSRTLTDAEVDDAVQAVASRLQAEFGATIRGDTRGGVDQGGTG
jgi:phenylalanyl-tRNA synthetase beta chain